jgi:hypothetical protein
MNGSARAFHPVNLENRQSSGRCACGGPIRRARVRIGRYAAVQIIVCH